jgi:hypothetical protein
MALSGVAWQEPLYQRFQKRDLTLFEPGAPFAGLSFHEQNALQDALRPMERDMWASKERASVLRVLKVKAEGAPQLMLGPKKLAALPRWAEIFERTLATNEAAWAAATKFVERPDFAAFLTLLRGLPTGDHVLMANTD